MEMGLCGQVMVRGGGGGSDGDGGGGGGGGDGDGCQHRMREGKRKESRRQDERQLLLRHVNVRKGWMGCGFKGMMGEKKKRSGKIKGSDVMEDVV
ncbi:hypothetical protein E2C01_079001 [Portunus trituberculatus]|uniref:Uncharacterized protein n=1 Tax=Portunus trituberculatus TaxID=210409 RepID=A0A5B7IQ88_PORTR|nr:hypothetical protein [Portunus trituberculatus]